MTKPKLLTRTSAKHTRTIASERLDEPARPRTAGGGDRGFLRRLGFGRGFFGKGLGSSANIKDNSDASQSSNHIRRSISVQDNFLAATFQSSTQPAVPQPIAGTIATATPIYSGLLNNHHAFSSHVQPDLGSENLDDSCDHQPQPQPWPRPRFVETLANSVSTNRVSRYSMLSRRSSAPDCTTDMDHRKSRFASPNLTSYNFSFDPQLGDEKDEENVDARLTRDSGSSYVKLDEPKMHTEGVRNRVSSQHQDDDYIPLRSTMLPQNNIIASAKTASSQPDASQPIDDCIYTKDPEVDNIHDNADALLQDVQPNTSDSGTKLHGSDIPKVTLVWRQQKPPSLSSESPRMPLASSLLSSMKEEDNAFDSLSLYASSNGTDTVSSIDTGSSVIVMGSVKDRGDKRASRQKAMSESSTAARTVKKTRNPSLAAMSLVSASPVTSAASPLSRPLSITASKPSSPSLSPVLQQQVEEAEATEDLGKGDANSATPYEKEQKSVPSRTNLLPSLPLNLRRPKSLYEHSLHQTSLLNAQRDGDSTHASRGSSSIAAAKAFLTMIASGNNNGNKTDMSTSTFTTELTINTSATARQRGSSANKCHSSSASSSTNYPNSAPLTTTVTDNGKKGSSTCNTQYALCCCDTPCNENSHGGESPGFLGGKSFRERSKLASAGIRRASTYVWNRSSVFMRNLSSTEELMSSDRQLKPANSSVSGVSSIFNDELDDSSKGYSDYLNRAATTDKENADPVNTKMEDLATNKSCDSLVSEGAAIPQAPPPPPLPPLPLAKSPAIMRLNAARELVMTEKNFVDNLFVIKKIWMEPVFSSANSPKPIIPYQTARIIFYGITELHLYASQFYRDMDYIVGNFERNQKISEGDFDDGIRIGTLFRANDRHWKDFEAYVRNYGTAVNCLRQLQDYKPYLRYHEECMLQKRTNRQSLKDLLMLPIQRITRYTLLLKNILKHTHAMHSDHVELCRAVKNMTHFAFIVNECRRKQEEMSRLIEVFGTIDKCPPLPHSDSRIFISEYVVKELITRVPTRLLLFSDMLIVTQAPTQPKLDEFADHSDYEIKWSYHGMALLDHVEIQNADESIDTLITILSLNRTLLSSTSSPHSRHTSTTKPATPIGSASPLPHTTSSSQQLSSNETAGSSLSHDNLCSSTTLIARGVGKQHMYKQNGSKVSSDVGISGVSTRRKKTKSRRGILRVSSRDSIPEHVAVLSHSTFSSPSPSPMLMQSQPASNQQKKQKQYRTSVSNASTSNMSLDPFSGQDGKQSNEYSTTSTSSTLPQRPKTASGGYSNTSFVSPELTGRLSNRTLPPTVGDLMKPSIPAGRNSSGSMPVTKPTQMTLVMQHSSSIARKQFVRSLKDATLKLTHYCDSNSTNSSELDAGADMSFARLSGSEVLNLHPL